MFHKSTLDFGIAKVLHTKRHGSLSTISVRVQWRIIEKAQRKIRNSGVSLSMVDQKRHTKHCDYKTTISLVKFRLLHNWPTLHLSKASSHQFFFQIATIFRMSFLLLNFLQLICSFMELRWSSTWITNYFLVRHKQSVIKNHQYSRRTQITANFVFNSMSIEEIEWWKHINSE